MKLDRRQTTAKLSARRRGVGLSLLLITLAFSLTACTGPRELVRQNDALRKQNLRLTQQLEQLQASLTLRESELRATREQINGGPLPEIEPPRIAGIVVGRYSGGIDKSGDGRPDELRIYLRPVDPKGRFISAAGSARVRLLHTPADGDPITLVDVAYDPDAFDASYRSGFTGTHYTLAADLPEDLPDQALLQVSFNEAGRGLNFNAQRVLPLTKALRPMNEDE
ncbi:MAG: hypothetical protein AAGC44_04020 [Planctomycetota bacterium]